MRRAVSIIMSFWVSDTEGRGRGVVAKDDGKDSSLGCSVGLALAALRRVASEEGGGDLERDFVDVGGEDDEEEDPMPRCLITVLTIISLSAARASSMPSRMAAASIMRTCWCLDSKNLVALFQ